MFVVKGCMADLPINFETLKLYSVYLFEYSITLASIYIFAVNILAKIM